MSRALVEPSAMYIEIVVLDINKQAYMQANNNPKHTPESV